MYLTSLNGLSDVASQTTAGFDWNDPLGSLWSVGKNIVTGAVDTTQKNTEEWIDKQVGNVFGNTSTTSPAPANPQKQVAEIAKAYTSQEAWDKLTYEEQTQLRQAITSVGLEQPPYKDKPEPITGLAKINPFLAGGALGGLTYWLSKSTIGALVVFGGSALAWKKLITDK